MMKSRVRLGLTMGDPAGIGPEIALKAIEASSAPDAPGLVVIGTARCLEATARRLGVRAKIAPGAERSAWPEVAVIEAAASDVEIAPGEAAA